MRTSALFAALALAASASAKTIVVTVRTNLTYNGTGDGDASGVFRPQQIDAQVGDQLLFNFTRGNHSVIQSTFDQPCVPISEHNTTVNGFNTGYRDTNNGTAITDFLVDITPEWENQTIWFYDGNTCGIGGVGAVNVNGTSWETFDGYVRNARRLFGPDKAKPAPSTTKKPSSTGGSPQGTDTPEDSVVRAASFSAVAVLAATLALVL